ncbi:WD40 repeat domain-containing protein [Nonomuraea sp. NPDC051191]|uniref:WD40 repeat domain-containing protein n=1 Tax=Nonomuraea sp. NPDC051191 TaxID=3364372 RepID=UPI003791F8B6
MRSRTEVALAGLIVLTLTGACADPATRRVSLVNAPSAPPSSSLAPAMPLVDTGSPTSPGSTPSPSSFRPPPLVPATSLAEPMATGKRLTATGPPRFFVTARTPIFSFADSSKTAHATPVPPAVNDAVTGAFVAAVPLPPGVRSSWHLVAAAPDNRTFVLAGWTGQDTPLRLFRIRLDERGRPGEPELVPALEPEPDQVTAMALSQDATRLAYTVTLIGGGTKVAVLELATGRRRDWVTRENTHVMGLAWAPDGRRLATARLPGGVSVLDLGNEGSDLVAASRPVTPDRAVWIPESVAFTPDGDALLYSTGHDVERVPVEGGRPQVVARLTLPRGASAGLNFSVDGTGGQLLYTYGWRAHRVDLADGSTTSVGIDAGKRSGEGGSPVVAW